MQILFKDINQTTIKIMKRVLLYLCIFYFWEVNAQKTREVYKDLDSLYLLIQTEYDLITKDYEEHIAEFDFNRVIRIREQIAYYLSHIDKRADLSNIKLLSDSLKSYPDTEEIFLNIRSQKAKQHQLTTLKQAFDGLQFEKVLNLVAIYSENGYIPSYELAYYKVMSEYRLFLKSSNNKQEREALIQHLTAYQKEHSGKSKIYDRVIDDTIKNVKRRR
ncbi:hypothetical protein VJJ50_06530 [Capnocytophaga ochracea]|jgi:hypothetical protein|uniref:hypothetical protein n=1 Tax=Capnocytophaga TaxID=1016 RepID=UPI0006AD910E|nr:hypothetical protein [Capnocytophaga ochracea]ALC96483.1 hypothetical protein AM608_01840 [Capnocytophaga sp. oral taxon 323]MEB3016534.1 hypothetical protein [Capnocytophaga ochracea]MEB3037219.1 hypothetical protein [Capnocytophaga ochracea]